MLNNRWLLRAGTLGALALLAVGATVVVGLSGRRPSPVVHRLAAEPAEIAVATSACHGSAAHDYSCYRDHYLLFARDSGAERAIAALNAESGRNRFVRAICHDLRHDIGRAAADHGGDLRATLSHGDDSCNAGYYHGIVETAVAKTGPAKIRTEINGICAEIAGRQARDLDRLECAHGLGHGLMVVFNDELFEALGACDDLTNVREGRQCYGGVFMENARNSFRIRDDPIHAPRYLDTQRPLYPCTIVAVRYKTACYLYHIPSLLRTQQGDFFATTFALCARIESGHRAACYRGVGGGAFAVSAPQFLSSTAQTKYASMLCMLGKDYEAQSNCVVGAAAGFTSEYRTDAKARMLCGFLKGELRAFCLRETDRYAKPFRPQSTSVDQ